MKEKCPHQLLTYIISCSAILVFIIIWRSLPNIGTLRHLTLTHNVKKLNNLLYCAILYTSCTTTDELCLCHCLVRTTSSSVIAAAAYFVSTTLNVFFESPFSSSIFGFLIWYFCFTTSAVFVREICIVYGITVFTCYSGLVFWCEICKVMIVIYILKFIPAML